MISLEQKFKEISAEKQNMSDSFYKSSAEINMVKLICEWLKSSKFIKPIQKEVKSVQSSHKILKCKVCELKFKDKHE